MRKKYSVLSNFDIIEIAKILDLNDLVFVGTQDLLNDVPKSKRKNKFYIINLDRQVQNGGDGIGNHWVMLSTHKKPFYADSFGLPPPERVISFVSALGFNELPYWDKQIQSLRSQICGWYSLMFCDLINQYYKNKLSLFDFVKDFKNMGWDFDKQEKTNNNIVLKYFSKRL
jgi:hypothetical protein